MWMRPGRRLAFSLAEVLVAVAVLVPVVVVTLGILPYSHLIDRRAWSMALAEDVALAQMEEARATDFDALPASRSFRETRDGLELEGEVTCRAVDAGPPVLLKHLTVTVRWKLQREERLVRDTLIARIGR